MGRRAKSPGSPTLVLLLALVCLLPGCSPDRPEPGLFGRSTGPTTVAPVPAPPSTNPTTHVVNPDLPVVGEAIWASADGLDVEVRIAVQAVRRIAGGTVLDWSVTPLAGAGLEAGDPVPAVDLGLDPERSGNIAAFLVDSDRQRAYPPLSLPSGGCLCTPPSAVERTLTIGETRLLQVTFPTLPSDTATIDVDVATVPIFWRVPVTGIGLVPISMGPTDLARPAATETIGPSTPSFSYGPSGQHFVVSVDAVIAASTFTSVRWTVQSLTAGAGLDRATSPPLARSLRSETNAATASGPRLTPTDEPSGSGFSELRVLVATTAGSSSRTCLCTDFRRWTRALRKAQQQATVVTNFAALPIGTQTVDVVFPGLATLEGVRLSDASDGTFRSAGPTTKRSATWTADPSRLSTGWPVSAWPTPLPAPGQLTRYTATVATLGG